LSNKFFTLIRKLILNFLRYVYLAVEVLQDQNKDIKFAEKKSLTGLTEYA
jgi:hypothetical protein